jgi:hypothetical protein
MTVTTAWCLALASALMISTESLPALAASSRAAASASTLRSGSGTLLIA